MTKKKLASEGGGRVAAAHVDRGVVGASLAPELTQPDGHRRREPRAAPRARRGARERAALTLPRRWRGLVAGARRGCCAVPPRRAEASAARVALLAGLAAVVAGGLRVAVAAVGGSVGARVRRPPRLEVERRAVGLGRLPETERRPVGRRRPPPVTVRLLPAGIIPWLRRRRRRRRVRPSRRLGGGGGTRRRVAVGEHLPRLLEQPERAVGGGRAVLVGVEDEAEAPVLLLDVLVGDDRLLRLQAQHRVPPPPPACDGARGGVDVVRGGGVLEGRDRREEPPGVPGRPERAGDIAGEEALLR